MAHRQTSIKVGDVFNRLTVIRQLPRDEYDNRSVKRTLFECKCACGNYKVIDAGNLKKAIKSCGCLVREQAIAKGKAQRTALGFYRWHLCNYRRGAKERNYSFNLSLEKFIELVSGDCHYCNGKPMMKEGSSYKMVGLAQKITGIDRIDSNVGYEIENCVSCCSTCNMMKMRLSYSDFIKHIVNIYNNLGE